MPIWPEWFSGSYINLIGINRAVFGILEIGIFWEIFALYALSFIINHKLSSRHLYYSTIFKFKYIWLTSRKMTKNAKSKKFIKVKKIFWNWISSNRTKIPFSKLKWREVWRGKWWNGPKARPWTKWKILSVRGIIQFLLFYSL